MLYLSTRNRRDSYTAYRALHEDRTPDGGLFVPFHLPKFSRTEISAMREETSGQIIANILNLFFSCRLNGWDVDASIGRNPIRIVSLGQKVTVVEDWHVLGNEYSALVNCLYEKVCGGAAGTEPSRWFRIAARIAVLFAVFSDLHSDTEQDISVSTGDFTDIVAIWYAREMGLPIGMIQCCGVDDSAMWDLVKRGECATSQLTKDSHIEHLIFETCGQNAVAVFTEKHSAGATFRLSEEETENFGKGIFAAVIGKNRPESLIRSVYRNEAYVIDDKTAIAFCGIHDFRAQIGISRPTVVMADADPRHCADTICQAAGISCTELEQCLNAVRE